MEFGNKSVVARRISVRKVLQRVLLPLVVLLVFPVALWAQDVEDYYARMLEEEVEVVNPVKRPVISAGVGVTHFIGEVGYTGDNLMLGSWAARLNVSTLIGKAKQTKLNVFMLYGMLEGIDYKQSLPLNTKLLNLTEERWFPNASFQTQIYELGVSVEYNFWHIFGKEKTVKPYVSLGAGLLIFTPKANYMNSDREFYHFWSDGTVRMAPEGTVGAEPVRMDRVFETDMKKANIWRLNNIPPLTAVIPVEVGLDFNISDRVALRAFTSLHYTLTDMLDGLSPAVAKFYDGAVWSTKAHDMYMYTGLSFSFDFFSEAESFIVDKAFANIADFDYEVFFSDQDNDGVVDRLDECPDTPEGVAVDSVGCPLDSDRDGIPDYLDQEVNTPVGQPVNERGQSLDEKGMTLPVGEGEAVLRKNVRLNPVSPQWSRRYDFQGKELPERLRSADLDGDGTITFEEVIRAVDDYFSGSSQLTPADIYELNAFFFTQ